MYYPPLCKGMSVMYTISKKIFNEVLKRKYKSLIGNLCERIENIADVQKDRSALINQIKFDVKKDIFNAFHEIEEQINSFSEGTTISVNLIKPTSDKG
jgi:hypothetical protein